MHIYIYMNTHVGDALLLTVRLVSQRVRTLGMKPMTRGLSVACLFHLNF